MMRTGAVNTPHTHIVTAQTHTLLMKASSDVRATHQRRRGQSYVAYGGSQFIDRGRRHSTVCRQRLDLDFELFPLVLLLFWLIRGEEVGLRFGARWENVKDSTRSNCFPFIDVFSTQARNILKSDSNKQMNEWAILIKSIHILYSPNSYHNQVRGKCYNYHSSWAMQYTMATCQHREIITLGSKMPAK